MDYIIEGILHSVILIKSKENNNYKKVKIKSGRRA